MQSKEAVLKMISKIDDKYSECKNILTLYCVRLYCNDYLESLEGYNKLKYLHITSEKILRELIHNCIDDLIDILSLINKDGYNIHQARLKNKLMLMTSLTWLYDHHSYDLLNFLEIEKGFKNLDSFIVRVNMYVNSLIKYFRHGYEEWEKNIKQSNG